MPGRIDFSDPVRVELARLHYFDRRVTLKQAAQALNTDDRGLRRVAGKLGWHDRPVATMADARESLARRAAQAASGPTPDATAPVLAQPMTDAARRRWAAAMESMVAGCLTALQRNRAAGSDGDPDRTAREIGHQTRTLQAIQAYRKALGPENVEESDEPPARSLDELRDELRRHLERIRTEERPRRIRGGVEPQRGRVGAGPLADALPAGPATTA
jgi:hypothetical protein